MCIRARGKGLGGLFPVFVGPRVGVGVERGGGGGVGLLAGMVGNTAVADGKGVGVTLGVGGLGGLLQAASKLAIKANPPRSRVRR